MIARIWHGYATPDMAECYRRIVTEDVIPGIFAMNIPGFERIELYRRAVGTEIEFVTVMTFTDLDAVRAFTGKDYARCHVPPRAREVLMHFDEHAAHYEVLLEKVAP